MNSLYELDKSWFLAINQGWHSELLNPVFVFLTSRSSSLFIMGIYLVYLIYKRNKQEWIYFLAAGAAVGLADLVSSSVLKPLFERIRPCEVIAGVNFWNVDGNPDWKITDGITSYKGSKSFPSSHAANSMAFALFVGWQYKKMLTLLITVAVLVGISRVYVGVHYPSDVLGGMAAGLFIAGLVRYSYEWIKEKYFPPASNP